ncbi:uncharacterized protein LOC132752932 [Ruditapes philippinarum]|uniref:uncharacterized protein LOC132752932 n=1 Tax=Ruditapes philippinarum TaxID=129788 RepID=UPI00295A8B35|nr:uncharacterized protein LOC132752932 [Ruditapes philippinarum]
MTVFLAVTLLMVVDVTDWHIEIGWHCNRHENSSKHLCENCVWGSRFKTYQVLYNGGRELQLEKLANITVLNENQCKHKKFLVYKCDSSSLCGGFADRQKGIISTFLLALLTNRKFIIDMTSPCNLEEFLEPNVYNWNLCKAYLKTMPNKNISKLNYVENYKFIKGINQFDFDRNWTKGAVVLKFNGYAIDKIRQHKETKSRLEWLLNITNEEAIHLVLNTLFKPGERLFNDAINFYNNHINGRKLICSHIRKGKNPTLPTDNRLRFGSPNETVIFEYLKKLDKNSKNAIYIAADSEEVKQSAKGNLTSYININRTIVHIDRLAQFKKQKSEACDGFYTAVFEQFILSLCDKLILTRSGFGTIAAYIRGVSDELFLYHPKLKIIVETNLTNIQKVFKFKFL